MKMLMRNIKTGTQAAAGILDKSPVSIYTQRIIHSILDIMIIIGHYGGGKGTVDVNGMKNLFVRVGCSLDWPRTRLAVGLPFANFAKAILPVGGG